MRIYSLWSCLFFFFLVITCMYWYFKTTSLYLSVLISTVPLRKMVKQPTLLCPPMTIHFVKDEYMGSGNYTCTNYANASTFTYNFIWLLLNWSLYRIEYSKLLLSVYLCKILLYIFSFPLKKTKKL